MVYADSLTPVSADDFLFTRSKDYPHAVDDFERSYTFFTNTPCDILLTPHPEISRLWDRLGRRDRAPDALIDPTACKELAAVSRQRLQARLAAETNRPAPAR
jgi:metallo-beta-lactamase class B